MVLGPMGVGADPQQMAAVKAITSNIRAQMRVDKAERSLTLKLNYDGQSQEVHQAVQNLLSQLTDQFATQLDVFFGIKGEIIEVTHKE